MSDSRQRWFAGVTRSMLLALLALGVLSAVAVAATINGNGANNDLFGTPSADVINGKGGNDAIYGNLGDDFIDGGAGGDDRGSVGLVGGSGNDRVTGGAGDDLIDGDYVNCLSGPGCIQMNVPNNEEGNDNLDGGPGDDDLFGNGGNDVLIGGPGKDFLLGENGNDRIYARDGEVDLIVCGPGFDRVQYDKNLDTFAGGSFSAAGCEDEILL